MEDFCNLLFNVQQHSTVQDVFSKDLDGLRFVVLIWRQGDEGQTVLGRERPFGLERRWKKSDARRVHSLQEGGRRGFINVIFLLHNHIEITHYELHR